MIYKRITAAALAVITAVVLIITPAFGASLSNIRPVRGYNNAFRDVLDTDWFRDSVAAGYEYGYFDGHGGGVFSPRGTVTVAEALKLAACIRSAYETGTVQFTNGDPWYEPYYAYAVANGIVETGKFSALNAPITRADFAVILARALPEEAYAAINAVSDGAVPDVPMTFSYAAEVYALYRAGILTGSDERGVFYPNRSITRAEAAAVIVRIVNPLERVDLPDMLPVLSSEALYEQCSPAVFLFEIFDKDGELVRTGSGFFISADGFAVTNCHVAANVYSAKITLSNGEQRDVLGVFDRDLLTDCALVQIEQKDGEQFPFLRVRDSATVKTGEEIYTISSPIGLLNSMSRGIISTSNRVINDVTYIQLDAAISSGSSGGALIDSRGQVIGITSAAVNGGESLNLAMPINVLNALEITEYLTFEAFEKSLPYYYGFFPVPDYGKFAGVSPLITEELDHAYDYFYRLPYSVEREELVKGYIELLEENGFLLYFTPTEENKQYIYINYMFGMVVIFGEIVYNGVRYWNVEVMSSY